MAHAIPKIVYGTLNTTISLPYPPKNKGEDEQDDSVEHTLVSLSGQRQVSVDFIEVKRKLVFGGLSEAQKETLRSFFRGWAYLGKSFRYYDDGNSSAYETFELDKLEFKPKRTGISGTSFTYEVPLALRRVEDEDVVDYLEATIANNQAVAADVTGLVLDSTSYRSVKIFYDIKRKTDTTEYVENGYLTATYKESTGLWDITPEGTFDGDDSGVSFSMDGDQVQYTSSNMSGGNYTGTMHIKEIQL